MRRYETIVIIDPDLPSENCALIFDKLNELIEQHKGLLIETDDWGTKKLAYEIKKKYRGHYVCFNFCSKVTVIREMEHFFRINDSILKFMTIMLDRKADIEAIKNTIAETEQNEAQIDTELDSQEDITKHSESEIIVNNEE